MCWQFKKWAGISPERLEFFLAFAPQSLNGLADVFGRHLIHSCLAGVSRWFAFSLNLDL